MLGGKMEENRKTVEKLAKIFGTSLEILKGRDDGLEEVIVY